MDVWNCVETGEWRWVGTMQPMGVMTWELPEQFEFLLLLRSNVCPWCSGGPSIGQPQSQTIKTPMRIDILELNKDSMTLFVLGIWTLRKPEITFIIFNSHNVHFDKFNFFFRQSDLIKISGMIRHNQLQIEEVRYQLFVLSQILVLCAELDISYLC